MTKSSRFLHRYIQFTAFCTFLLLFAGGLVTSTGSGLSVPDWPLSYGTLFPPMIGGIRFEHTHRLVAGFVGILTALLMIFIFRIESRSWMKKLGVVAFVAVLAQAILGGITVKFLLPTSVSVTHACLAQTFFALMVCLVLFTSEGWRSWPVIETRYSRPIKSLLITTSVFAYLQLIAGAFVRHTQGGHGLNTHLIIASLIVIHVIFILFKVLGDSKVQSLFIGQAVVLIILVLLQIFLGMGAFIFTVVLEKNVMPGISEVLFRTAHQTNGALILAVVIATLVKSFRVLKSAKH